MRKTASAFAIGIFLAAGGQSVEASSILAAHRAVYDISLKFAEDRSGITGANGRMVIELSGGECTGWTINFRMVNRFLLNGGEARTIDSRSSMWESGSSDQLRYVQRQYVDNRLQEEKEIKAKLRKARGSGEGVVTKPTEERFTLPDGATFPVDHQLKLVLAAKQGKNRDETLLYDGSDGPRPTIAITFIGNRKNDGLADSAKGENIEDLAGMSGWPVSISYFKPDRQGQEMPDYQVDMMLLENGVSGDMQLNYGEFVLDAKLAGLELLEQAECD